MFSKSALSSALVAALAVAHPADAAPQFKRAEVELSVTAQLQLADT